MVARIDGESKDPLDNELTGAWANHADGAQTSKVDGTYRCKHRHRGAEPGRRECWEKMGVRGVVVRKTIDKSECVLSPYPGTECD